MNLLNLITPVNIQSEKKKFFSSTNYNPYFVYKWEAEDLSEEEYLMLQGYLLHILQFGTPEKRLKILSGIQTTFELTERLLIRA